MSAAVPLATYVVDQTASLIPEVNNLVLVNNLAMTEPVHQIEAPSNTQLSPLTHLNMLYAESLYKPYQDAIAVVETVDPIKAWLPQVYSPELTAQLLVIIDSAGTDINVIRQAIGLHILETFFSHQFNPNVTPWSLTDNMTEEGEKLFGLPVTNMPVKLSVVVSVGPTHYVHELDQDTTYGILLGLHDNPGIKLYVAGVEVTEEMLEPFYAVPPQTLQTKSYSMVFYNGRKEFNTSNVITGYITASGWLGIDPHTSVRDMRQLHIDLNGVATFTPLSF